MVLATKRQEAWEEVWADVSYTQEPVPVPRRRRRLRLHPMILLSIMAVLVVTLTVIGISQKVKVIELEYSLQSLEAQLEEVRREGQQLQLKVEQLQSLTHIEQIARSRLGMVEPQEAEVLVLVDWDSWSDTQLAAEPESSSTLVRGGKRLWTALVNWLGPRFPGTGAAEAGLLR
ncbi:MAG: septum formation initiator family protein [Firmicutes bacterium]|nr:septum formation initiator family protein [Bacillota bacterium]